MLELKVNKVIRRLLVKDISRYHCYQGSNNLLIKLGMMFNNSMFRKIKV